MALQKKPQHADPDYWQSVIDSWRLTRLSVSRFCRNHDLKPHQFRYWQYRLAPATKKKSSSSSKAQLAFTEIKVPLSTTLIDTPTILTPFELITPSGYRLKLNADFDEPLLIRVLTLLEALP